MSSLAARPLHVPQLSRLGWLMALYAENHVRLVRLFEPGDLAEGTYLSRTGNGLDLRLDVLVRHAYTSELRLAYDALPDPVTGEADPSVYVRLYRDARQAEATHCYVGRRWQDTIGMFPPPKAVLGHRVRMNTFLGKWLQYLAEQGHGVATLAPSGSSSAAPDAVLASVGTSPETTPR